MSPKIPEKISEPVNQKMLLEQSVVRKYRCTTNHEPDIEAIRFSDESKNRAFNFVRDGRAQFDDRGGPFLSFDATGTGKRITVRFGEWILKGSDGVHYKSNHELFVKSYALVEEEPSSAYEASISVTERLAGEFKDSLPPGMVRLVEGPVRKSYTHSEAIDAAAAWMAKYSSLPPDSAAYYERLGMLFTFLGTMFPR